MKLEKPEQLFTDCAVSLDVRSLYRSGLFGAEAATVFVDGDGPAAGTPGFGVSVRWDPQGGRIWVGAPGEESAQAQPIDVSRREERRGGGYFFISPADGRRIEKLYYVDGGWGSRSEKGVRYASRSGSQGDRYRHALRRLAAQLESPDTRCPMARERLEARVAGLERKVADLPRRRVTRLEGDPSNFSELTGLVEAGRRTHDEASITAPAMGTEAAMSRAAATPDDGEEMGWMLRRAEGFRRLLDLAPPGMGDRLAGLAPDYAADHPRISLSCLQAHGLLKNGARRGVRLDWTGLGGELVRCNLVLDLREDGDGFAALEMFVAGQLIDQALRIVTGAAGEIAFVCPLSGALAPTVSYRAGGFASPAALRLTRKVGWG